MVPLMAGQMPVVVVSGGEFAVVLRNRPLPGRGDPCYFCMALQPNGFCRFRLVLWKVPGLSANSLGLRGGDGAKIQEKETRSPKP